MPKLQYAVMETDFLTLRPFSIVPASPLTITYSDNEVTLKSNFPTRILIYDMVVIANILGKREFIP